MSCHRELGIDTIVTRAERSARFDAQAFLDSPGIDATVVSYGRNETIFRQSDDGDAVMFIRTGAVKLSVLSNTGRDAVVAILAPGEFFGEACLAGQPLRMGTATAITPSVIVVIRKAVMIRALSTSSIEPSCPTGLVALPPRSQGNTVPNRFQGLSPQK